MVCDCHLRPLWTWLSNQPNTTLWDNVLCHLPPILAGRRVTSLDIDELTCMGKTFEAVSLIKPDIKIRGSEILKDHGLRVVWYVATREDVAGFKATLRNVSGTLVAEEEVPYNKREYVFRNLEPKEIYNLCFVAIDSRGNERGVYESQCSVVGPVGGTQRLYMYSFSEIFVLLLCLCATFLCLYL